MGLTPNLSFQASRNSLPRIVAAFGSRSFQDVDVLFKATGDVALEYKLPALSAWVDMILLGEFEQRPSAVFIELKDWTTKGDLPGSY